MSRLFFIKAKTKTTFFLLEASHDQDPKSLLYSHQKAVSSVRVNEQREIRHLINNFMMPIVIVISYRLHRLHAVCRCGIQAKFH